MSVWVRQLENEEYAVGSVSFRNDGRPQPMTFTLEDVSKIASSVK